MEPCYLVCNFMPGFMDLSCSWLFSTFSCDDIIFFFPCISTISFAFSPEIIIQKCEANYLSYFHCTIYPVSNRQERFLLPLMSVLQKHLAEELSPHLSFIFFISLSRIWHWVCCLYVLCDCKSQDGLVYLVVWVDPVLPFNAILEIFWLPFKTNICFLRVDYNVTWRINVGS